MACLIFHVNQRVALTHMSYLFIYLFQIPHFGINPALTLLSYTCWIYECENAALHLRASLSEHVKWS